MASAPSWRPRRVSTNNSRPNLPVPNLNARAFTAAAPGSPVDYIPTAGLALRSCHHGFFSRKIIGWVMRHHRRKLGQSKGRSPSRRNYVRTPLVFVILIARSCWYCKTLPTSYAVSVDERFQFERRVFEDDESACEQDAMDNQTSIARNLASSMCPVLAPQLRS